MIRTKKPLLISAQSEVFVRRSISFTRLLACCPPRTASRRIAHVSMITVFSAFVNGNLSITQMLDFSRELWEDLLGRFLVVRKKASKF
jgi:hypothetical protein